MLSDDLKRRYDLEYDPNDELLITVGVSEGLDLAMRAILDPGDGVIVARAELRVVRAVRDAGGRDGRAGGDDGGERLSASRRSRLRRR